MEQTNMHIWGGAGPLGWAGRTDLDLAQVSWIKRPQSTGEREGTYLRGVGPFLKMSSARVICLSRFVTRTLAARLMDDLTES